jgi:hypothetical protein
MMTLSFCKMKPIFLGCFFLVKILIHQWTNGTKKNKGRVTRKVAKFMPLVLDPTFPSP